MRLLQKINLEHMRNISDYILSSIKDIPIYPFLFGIYPILHLYKTNMSSVLLSEIILPILIVSIIIIPITIGGKYLLGNFQRIAFIIFVIEVVTNSQIISGIRSFLNNNLIHWEIYLRQEHTALLVIVPLALFYFILDSKIITRYLNVTSIILVLLITLDISLQTFKSYDNFVENESNYISQGGRARSSTIANDSLPDIYYIILDAYTGNSNLNNYYNFDNHDITDYLESNDFYVPSNSYSNYEWTHLSIPSSLNMKYLDVGNGDIYASVLQSEESKFLRDIGYKMVILDDKLLPNVKRKQSYLSDSDIYISSEQTHLTNFNHTLAANNNATKLILKTLDGVSKKNQVKFAFTKLGQIPDIHYPTFTFSHIWAPHFPFGFDSTGQEYSSIDFIKGYFANNSDAYRAGYVSEIKYLNIRIKELIEMLLNKSSVPPIIIIQGDHGSREKHALMRNPTIFNHIEFKSSTLIDWYSIFVAIYLPDGGQTILYDSISPVNIFRLINDYYFKSNFGLLEDKSYRSIGRQNGTEFIDISDSLKAH